MSVQTPPDVYVETNERTAAQRLEIRLSRREIGGVACRTDALTSSSSKRLTGAETRGIRPGESIEF
jgi:hypothetical protein